MDILRTIAHQPISNPKMCDHSLNKPSEIKRKKSEEHIPGPQEMSRIVTDSTTGKCYCRGKVLGKVRICIGYKYCLKYRNQPCSYIFPMFLEIWFYIFIIMIVGVVLLFKVKIIQIISVGQTVDASLCASSQVLRVKHATICVSVSVNHIINHVSALFPGWICQMLRIHRLDNRKSIRCEDHSTHSRLQAASKGKGMHNGILVFPGGNAFVDWLQFTMHNHNLIYRSTERQSYTVFSTTDTSSISTTTLKTKTTSTFCWSTAVDG